jgi:hypothetical protein
VLLLFDEVAEAEVQGLPYVLGPRPLSKEGMDRAVQPEAGWRVQVINDHTGHMTSASTRRLALSNE